MKKDDIIVNSFWEITNLCIISSVMQNINKNYIKIKEVELWILKNGKVLINKENGQRK